MSVEAMQKVSPEDGLKVLKNTAHPIYRAFQGQGDSPASAIPVAIAGYENALYEIDRLRAELEQSEARVRELEEKLSVNTCCGHLLWSGECCGNIKSLNDIADEALANSEKE